MSEKINLVLPVGGQILPLSEVDDYLFNKKLMGEGVAINPKGDYICSPIDGKIILMYEGKHAIAIQGESGIKILIHVGLDTAKLEGRGFGAYVKLGDKVKAGDKILFFDKEYLEEKSSLTTPMVITNSDNVENFEVNYSVSKVGKKFATVTLK